MQQESAAYNALTVMGIDLGTCYSCMHVFRHCQIIVVPGSDGSRTIPSYVAFRGEKFIFGAAAKQSAESYSESTVFDLKRMIGQSYEDLLATAPSKMWPFEFQTDECNNPIIVLRKKETHQIILQQYPIYFITMFLWHLKCLASSFIGEEIKNAVITVPTFFTSLQTNVIAFAAKQAGINILALYEEPSAAALAYGIHSTLGVEYTLVYDLGGGTFDVSLIRSEGNSSNIIAADGHHRLGGQDFDELIMNDFISHIKSQKSDFTIAPRRYNSIRKSAEQMKIDLSTLLVTEVSLYDGDYVFTYDRNQFEMLIDRYINLTISICERMLLTVHVQKENINRVVLVGGSSRIPLVKKALLRYFASSYVLSDINPDEVVSAGACMMAVNCQSRIMHLTPFYDLNITPMIIRTIGISINGTTMPMLKRGCAVDEMYTVDVNIPIGKGDVATVNVMQCNDEHAQTYDKIGSIDMSCLTKRWGQATITVDMKQDNKGVLYVYIYEKGKDRGHEFHVKLISDIPENELDNIIDSIKKAKEQENNAEKCDEIRREIKGYISEQKRKNLLILPLLPVAKLRRKAIKECESKIETLNDVTNISDLNELFKKIKADFDKIQ